VRHLEEEGFRVVVFARAKKTWEKVFKGVLSNVERDISDMKDEYFSKLVDVRSKAMEEVEAEVDDEEEED
jgi:hypothetical protein